jgi:periplasmic protein TonB
MPLRCLVFSPDEETLRTIGQVLTDLEIEGEACFKAVEAIEKVTARPFQIVIIDWSSQPEAGFLLNSARERRPPDRPLTLAIVSDDASVPTALQAGANSVLRRPLLANQVRDTLATARDLLRSKLEAPGQASAAAAAASSTASAMLPMEVQSTLRAGEFLQPSGSVPGTQFDTESSDVQKSLDQVAASEIDPLQDLEPTAGPVSQAAPATSARMQPAHTQPAPAPAPGPVPDDEPHGLAWYLKTRAKSLPPEEQAAQPESQPEKAQLLGYAQPPSFSQVAPAPDENPSEQADAAESAEPHSDSEPHPQQREEAELFAYISGEKTDSEKEPSPPRPWLKKLAIAAAVVVAGSVAYFTVPHAVMQKDLKLALGPVVRAGRSWLNPQPVSTPQAPQSHESFGRAGDEYKLPVAENIPDANTDPSQIRVVPMIDPTVKPPNNAAAGTDPNAAQATPGSTDPAQTDPNQAAAGQVVPGQVAAGQVAAGQTVPGQTPDGQPAQNQPQENQPQQSQAAGNPPQSVTPQPQQATTSADQQGSATQAPPSGSPDPLRPSVSAAAQPSTNPIPTPAVQTTQSAPVIRPVHSVSVPVVAAHNASTPSHTGIPSSLKSQMAQMSPEASGNKAPEAALPSIEPVNLPEAAARGLLLSQPTPAYPPSARGQTGTVTLQVLIGRDGTVQDAKFLQGSLAFARPAIDAVKQWRFKPYLMNGRPASTQTLLTLSFKPGS